MLSMNNVERAEDAPTAVGLLAEHPLPSAVLVTDEGLTLRENAHVWNNILDYVRLGGTAVVMGLFASFVEPIDIQLFFACAGLDWDVGSYGRTTTELDRAAVGAALASKLPPRYSQRALSLRNLAPNEAWYRHTDEEVHSDDEDIPIWEESPVVMARVGHGRLGFVGDLEAEPESGTVILAMCGLPV
ncbi:hypothetical protein HIM_01005 [Hirsutella minnesotensis 3608]|nr:hypothetical protein HIM_01005 [Hirsutella minnesotensis 3608]